MWLLIFQMLNVMLLFLNFDFQVQSTGQLVTVRGCSSFDSQTFPVAWQKAMVGDYWEVKYLKVVKGVSFKWKIFGNDHNHYRDKSQRPNNKLIEGCNKENDAWYWFKMWNNIPPSRATTFSQYATTLAVTLQKAFRLKSLQFCWYFRGSLLPCDSSIHRTELKKKLLSRKKVWYFQTRTANDLHHLRHCSFHGAGPKCGNKVRIPT